MLNHLDVVLSGDASQVGDRRDHTLLPLRDLAEEVDIFQLVDRELQVLLHMLEEDLVEHFLALTIDETVTVDTLTLVDQSLDQRTCLKDLVPQNLEDQLGDHAWREEVVPMVVNRELALNFTEEIDHEAGEAASRAS